MIYRMVHRLCDGVSFVMVRDGVGGGIHSSGEVAAAAGVGEGEAPRL